MERTKVFEKDSWNIVVARRAEGTRTIPGDVIVSIPEECATIHSGIASIMAKALIEAIPLGIVTSLRSSQ